ncbi:receptor-type tyrosine-protein phosphatase H-like isoform X2 [Corythoichthys intestinalis]|uniref:receptor-type tyrosine-protein phosphatase H-like isoform X2 n=1 Tax=Corythoichthys intestinalis TaxID=161448 RepID=UPI0025A6888D|nr:receptor-type tyrosine-protein phosphatase H-like isoform X2 [Corythoichthys intestinalis]
MVLQQNETSITLKWEKYHFRLITEFMGENSTGYAFSAPTAPLNAKGFKSIQRNTTSITLQWEKVENVNYTVVFNDTEEDVTSTEAQEVTHVIVELASGTEYTFMLFTVFEKVRSSGNTLTAVTAPKNVDNVHVLNQSETSITLSWKKVDHSTTYILQYDNHSTPISVFDSSAVITHRIPSLAAGKKYNFTLITVFGNVTSTGFKFDAATVPSMVTNVYVIDRAETSVTLEWKSADPNWGYLLYVDGKNISVPPKGSQIVSLSLKLQSGMEYPFTMTTLFSGLASTAYNGFFVTAIDCTAVTWHVTTSSIQGIVKGLFTNASASNGSSPHLSPEGQNVSFSSLYPGATYNVSLEYQKDSAHFVQCHLQLTTIPPDLTAHCKYWEFGYSVLIVWDKPDGLWTSVEVNVSEQMHTVEDMEQQHIEIGGFQPARMYKVSLSSRSGTVRRSEPYVFQCATDPRMVIAGSVLAVLLFCSLLGLAIFLLRRPHLRKRNSSDGSCKAPTAKIKEISLADFPAHFNKLSMDKNRGFSDEYESLALIGIEHTQNVALMVENVEKNRFTNVLPYDWSRVKLRGNLDYINASYMAGYNSPREYIATQGPLPSTVSDFWRMIWEQKVNAIVMVTNCTEGMRTKCEHYWPAHEKTCQHKLLTITNVSEQQDSSWTIREFRVKHKKTPDERIVKHFHFTAWPDHGVPQCTDVLIQFRSLIREHMDANGTKAPTVVHCSAGVGRTGTIIALDILLQQLHRDKQVSINALVHNMRLRRPHMVQTESQYVFLHQCIMDYLQSRGQTDESLNQNTDFIYENATALQEFNKMAV